MVILEEFAEQDIINAEIDDQFSFEPEDDLEDDSDRGKWLYYSINLNVYNSKDPKLFALV